MGNHIRGKKKTLEKETKIIQAFSFITSLKIKCKNNKANTIRCKVVYSIHLPASQAKRFFLYFWLLAGFFLSKLPNFLIKGFFFFCCCCFVGEVALSSTFSVDNSPFI